MWGFLPLMLTDDHTRLLARRSCYSSSSAARSRSPSGSPKPCGCGRSHNRRASLCGGAQARPTRRRCCMRSPQPAALRSTSSCTSRSSSNRTHSAEQRALLFLRPLRNARRHRCTVQSPPAGSVLARLGLHHVREVQRARAAAQSRAVFPARIRVCCALVESSALRQAPPPTAAPALPLPAPMRWPALSWHGLRRGAACARECVGYGRHLGYWLFVTTQHSHRAGLGWGGVGARPVGLLLEGGCSSTRSRRPTIAKASTCAHSTASISGAREGCEPAGRVPAPPPLCAYVLARTAEVGCPEGSLVCHFLHGLRSCCRVRPHTPSPREVRSAP